MNRYTVLVVEDNRLNFELVNDLLESHGFVVRHAWNAEEAIRVARADAPDIVLMDLSLPGMDGLHATQELKSHEATRSIPVVALTAHAMAGDEELTRSAGCDGYLSKPIDTRSFVASIVRYIQNSSRHQPEPTPLPPDAKP